MNPAQLLLRYHAFVERERALRDQIERLESRLQSDPEVVTLEEALQEARSAQDEVAARLRDSDHTREDHRSRLRTRERELMSGRIRNPTELMQLSEEVAHMKARFAQEEEAELRLMEEADAAEAQVRSAGRELEEARRQSAVEEPPLREQLQDWRQELADVEAGKEGVWSQ